MYGTPLVSSISREVAKTSMRENLIPSGEYPIKEVEVVPRFNQNGAEDVSDIATEGGFFQ